MFRWRSWIIGISVLTATMAIQPVSSQDETIPPFQLLILEPDWFELPLGYGPESLVQLETADYSSPLFVLELEDIEHYQWDWQMLTLTEAATQRLAESVQEQNRRADIQKFIDFKQSSGGWGNPLQSALYIQPFVVLVDGEFLYGGIFLDAMSQMAINYPVIRVEIVEGQAVFHILPIHIAFVNYDPVPRSAALDEAYNSVIEQDRQSIPDFFDSAVNEWAMSDNAVYFRELIRNERLFEALQAAEKLTGEPE